MTLSAEELAARAGTTAEQISRHADLRILPSEPPFEETLVPRARLALELEASGIPLEQIGRRSGRDGFSLSFADRVFGRPVAMLPTTYAELLDELRMSERLFDEVLISLGMAADEPVREDDAELLRLLDRMIKLGLDEPSLTRFLHIVVDSTRRMADAGREMWRTGVEAPLLASGLSHHELLHASSDPAPESQVIGDRLIGILWNRFIEQVVVQASIEHLELALEEAGVAFRRNPRPPAIAFVDLSGYTQMTDRVGDDAAAEHARSMLDVVRRTIGGGQGRLVKMLGDGAMLHFSEAGAAVTCGLRLIDRIPRSGLPPARLGIAAGPLIVRDADYFGRTVNVAARLADYARPSEVLVTSSVVDAAGNAAASFREIGPVALKGVSEPVTAFSAQPTEGS
ncbi:MAG TPA: adenylate/guanylate cyclase domain-containing protein [Actinomycetota bacterium]